ncbi:DNA damage-regulated autophagy modulator protein [Halocaridina rubra]|uniref:DNA damage-regulated autophagy modulator protein n=1 Tax=Halocaridina rubra TaxID=373956 RepID=A0AAN8X2E2_HALRR
MGSSYLYLLPLTVFVLFPSTFIITYTLSVLLHHTEPDFPYISDTGTYSPESCIFGQALNLGALVIFITIYVRYRQIKELYHNHSTSSHIVKLNRLGLLIGSLAALGISLVANFQETNVFFVHITGALMAFGLGTVYIWVQVREKIFLFVCIIVIWSEGDCCSAVVQTLALRDYRPLIEPTVER